MSVHEVPSGPVRAALLLTSVAALGCADPRGSGAPDPRVDTIDGVFHVWNPAQGAWAEGEAWSVEEVLRLGSLRGPEEELFSGHLLTGALGPDGAIYVQDYQAELISVFSPEGDFLRHIGGPGQGPGEFRSPSAFTWDGLGRLWVGSFGGRYTVFSPDGDFLRTRERPVRVLARRQHELHYLPDGGFLDEAVDGTSIVFLRVDTLGASVDTVGRLPTVPISDALRAVRTPPGSDFQTVAYTYIDRRRWATTSDRELWFANTGELRLTQMELGGDTLRVVHTRHRNPALSLSEQRMIDGALQDVGLERGDMNIVRRVLQQILVMDDSHVLVQIEEEVGEDGRIFDVFDPEGRYLGPLDFGFAPTRLGLVTFRGDTLLAPTEGRFDVPYIVKAVIHRPEVASDG